MWSDGAGSQSDVWAKYSCRYRGQHVFVSHNRSLGYREGQIIMSQKVFAIITWYKKSGREDAAEAWKEESVVAIGWPNVGDLRKIKDCAQLSEKLGRPHSRAPLFLWTFLKKMKKGDLILAYLTGNKIAYVGEVKGRYKYERKNKVGRDTNKGGFNYPHQRHISWWPEPRYFSRKELPMKIAEQFGKEGQALREIDPGHLGFEGLKDFLKANAKRLSVSSLEINEDTIKAGIKKYVRNYLDGLEKGLKITIAERGVSNQKRPDFLARDAKGNRVLIECKGTAYEDAALQAKKYLTQFRKEPGTRAMIIAFRITPECRKVANKSNIELFECDLVFKSLNSSTF